LARTDKDGAAPACHICDCRRVRERAEDTAGLDARASTDLSLFAGREGGTEHDRAMRLSAEGRTRRVDGP
jgi:hypothetical protein